MSWFANTWLTEKALFVESNSTLHLIAKLTFYMSYIIVYPPFPILPTSLYLIELKFHERMLFGWQVPLLLSWCQQLFTEISEKLNDHTLPRGLDFIHLIKPKHLSIYCIFLFFFERSAFKEKYTFVYLKKNASNILLPSVLRDGELNIKTSLIDCFLISLFILWNGVGYRLIRK